LQFPEVIAEVESGTVVSVFDRILRIRGEKVIQDSDLADFYGVETKRLNAQVRRNRNRFPSDFVFQRTSIEKKNVVANCDYLANLKFSKALPFAYAEHGALMAASILSSPHAIEASVLSVRTFVRLRRMRNDNRELNRRLKRIEASLMEHDIKIVSIFDLVRQLTTPMADPRRRIGFKSSP
jgi:hypothetical protein